MKAAVFVTTDVEAARPLLVRLRERFPDAEWHAYVRDDDREDLAADLQGFQVRRDKAEGGRLAFLRRLRAERYDLLVVALHGGDRSYPLKLVAPLCGARRAVGIDEGGSEVSLSLLWPVPLVRHLLRRALQARPDPIRLARALAALYRRTAGLLLGGAWVALRFAFWQLVRRRA